MKYNGTQCIEIPLVQEVTQENQITIARSIVIENNELRACGFTNGSMALYNDIYKVENNKYLSPNVI